MRSPQAMADYPALTRNCAIPEEQTRIFRIMVVQCPIDESVEELRANSVQQREDYELLVIKSTVDEEVHGAIIVLPRIQRIYEDSSGRAKRRSRRVVSRSV